jgi:hypothetical protein
MARRRQVAVVAAVFAAGVALRLGFMIAYRPAFLGDADAGSYIYAAQHGLFSNVYDPAGYALFIRAIHTVYPHLSLLIAVQHGLGIASAAMLYLSVRGVTGSSLLGLVPAAPVLFDGYGLWVEHTPISETLFTFLVVAALYVALRAVEGRRWLLIADGVLIASAATVRPVGLILIPVIGFYLFWSRSGTPRLRVLDSLILIAPVCLLLGGYIAAQHAETGFTGLTRDSGRILYARVAGFADCSKFNPPAGTRPLCERTPPGKRGSFNQYLTGFPDNSSQVSEAGRSISPAWRVFGPPPAGNAQLQSFGIAAIVHQPLDYLSAVADDFHYYWADHHRAFITTAARVDPNVENTVTSYYATGAGVNSGGLAFLRWYGMSIEVTGLLMIVLLLSPLMALLASERRARAAALLFACTGWLLPLISDAVASVDPRFILPAYGPLAAAATIGLTGPQVRRAVVRVTGSRRLGPAVRHP